MARLAITITGDATGARRAMRETEQSVSSLGGVLGRIGGIAGSALGAIGSALGNVASIAGGFVIGQGLLKLPELFMDTARAAALDEQATARVEAVLRNLPGAYDEMRAAVDAAIESGAKLAFTDDEIKNSFIRLAAATGDSEEALARQRAAMDLARGSGISLEQASNLLARANDENVQVLRRMGIVLREGATEADLLAEVQRRFGGSADAYARSTAGQFESAKVALQQAQQQIGHLLLPAFAELASFVAAHLPGVIDRVVAIATALRDSVIPWLDRFRTLALAVWRQVEEPLRRFASAILDTVVGAFVAVGRVLGAVFTLMTTNDPFGEGATAAAELADVLGEELAGRVVNLTQLVRALRPAWEGNEAGAAAFRQALVDLLGPEVGAGLAGVFELIRDTMTTLTTVLRDELVPVLSRLIERLDTGEGIVVLFERAVQSATRALLAFPVVAVALAVVRLAEELSKLRWSFGETRRSVEGSAVVLVQFGDVLGRLFGAVVAWWDQITPIWRQGVRELEAGWQQMTSGVAVSWQWVADVIDAILAGIIRTLMLGPAAVVQVVQSWDTLARGAHDAVKGWTDAIGAAIHGLVGWVRDAPGTVLGAVTGAWDGLAKAAHDAVKGWTDAIGNAVYGLVGWIRDAPGTVLGAVTGAWGALARAVRDAASGPLDTVLGWVNGLIGAVQWLLQLIGQIRVPGLESAGGRALAAAPEGLLSGSAAGGRGPTVSVTVHVSGSVVTEGDLVAAIHRGLLEIQRRNGSLGFV